MKEIIRRILADTPTFFKRLRWFGLSVVATGVALTQVSGAPAIIEHIGDHLTWVGGVIVAISTLAVSNPEDLKK